MCTFVCDYVRLCASTSDACIQFIITVIIGQVMIIVFVLGKSNSNTNAQEHWHSQSVVLINQIFYDASPLLTKAGSQKKITITGRHIDRRRNEKREERKKVCKTRKYQSAKNSSCSCIVLYVRTYVRMHACMWVGENRK